jgi:endonuclease/exonuclease/phosphatase family metal-dependent hydrolase
MTVILSWNIQSGRGADGRADVDRTVAAIKALGPADVICLQEVARSDPHWDRTGADQLAVIGSQFAGYQAFFGPAYDRQIPGAAARVAFGNLVLSRLPVLQVFAHPLPQRPFPDLRSMPRQALEVVVKAEGGPLRIVTTHLEYSDPRPRTLQIGRLRDLMMDSQPVAGPYATDGSDPSGDWPRPPEVVICGDFNMLPESPEYRRLLEPGGADAPSLCDAWREANRGVPHAPTAGVFDRKQWPQGPLCCDFFFVSEPLRMSVESATIDSATDASDHQPLRLDLCSSST